MEEYAGILLFIGLIVLAILIQQLLLRPKGPRKALTGHAVILSRRAEYSKAPAGRYSNNYNYRVVFQVGNQVLDLYVTQSEYPQLKEGLTGQLTWQYENLVDFIPDTN